MTDVPVRSPKIVSVSWGAMDIEGVGTGKDFKLYPGGGRPWDWRESGTQHSPGILPVDVEELLDKGAQVIVLSQGMHGALGVAPETLDMLKRRNIPVHIAKTPQAVDIYNRLAETQSVGGLFHSTC